MSSYYLQEDGSSKFLLEDGSGAFLLEDSSVELDVGFIASASTVYVPALQGGVALPFIQAGQSAGWSPISEDFTGNPLEFEQGLGQSYDDFTLDEPATVAVFAPTLLHTEVALPFIASNTALYGLVVGDPYALQVEADGPAFYWRLDESAGAATVADSSGNGHSGTVHGTVTLGQTSLLSSSTDTSAEFGGSSTDWVEGGDWDIPGSEITVECWVKPNTSYPADGAHIVAKHNTTADVQGSLSIHSDGRVGFEATVGGVYHSISGITVLAPGVAYHVAGVYDGSYLRIYVNGVEDVAVAATGSLATNNWEWSVGGLHGSASGVVNPWNGWLDEVAVYPSALTASQLWLHYELGAGLHDAIGVGFISSHTVVYAPSLGITLPFIASVTQVYPVTMPVVDLPFITSTTRVYRIFSLFNPAGTFAGPGNGGEITPIRLAANGVTATATLATNISASATSLTLTGDGSFPSSEPFVATIDSEVVYLVQLAPGSYRIRARGVSNTTPAAHTAGATVTWGDTYDMALVATEEIDTDFTADIEGTGSSFYAGWLMAFDSTQAYEADGTRFSFHVSELVGVFAAGAGTTGSNKTDGAQPSAIHAPEAASDHCGAALTVPALISTNILPGDVAVVRYTNPEAFTLDIGPRAVGIQSWYGLKRVDTTDHDVTFTDPNGIVVDTTGTYDTFTGSVNTEPDEPLPTSASAIAPDASDAAGHAINTPQPEPWLNVTLPGSDRYFTDGIHYNERGWPIGVLTVRHGNRRVPFWQSWDWHDFSYVYTGFGTDDSFAQVVINRNGMTGALPTISLPGSQDIDGPAAVWDDATYYFGASWYVVLVATPYLVIGPVIGGTSVGAVSAEAGIPGVIFGGGSPTISPPPTVEGGSGGDISPVFEGQLFQAAAV